MKDVGERLSAATTASLEKQNEDKAGKTAEFKKKLAADKANTEAMNEAMAKAERDNRIEALQKRAANMTIAPTDWEKIRKVLPLEKTEADEARRNELFDACDPNGNGFLSLAEVDLGLKNAMPVEELFKSKQTIIRAFNAAKNTGGKKKGQSKADDNYVSRDEFYALLKYLRQYFEYSKAFERIDAGMDSRVDIEEFIAAKPMIEKWVGPIADPEATFKEIDDNGGGQILFDEFCDWAIAKNLDLEDDDD